MNDRDLRMNDRDLRRNQSDLRRIDRDARRGECGPRRDECDPRRDGCDPPGSECDPRRDECNIRRDECDARRDDRDRRTSDSYLRADDAYRQIGEADLRSNESNLRTNESDLQRSNRDRRTEHSDRCCHTATSYERHRDIARRLRQSLTWDQGAEMAHHARLRIDSDVQIQKVKSMVLPLEYSTHARAHRRAVASSSTCPSGTARVATTPRPSVQPTPESGRWRRARRSAARGSSPRAAREHVPLKMPGPAMFADHVP